MTARYKTIAAPAEGLYKEKGSRFIAYAYPVATLAAIQEYLQHLRKEHHAARHCCYAYLLGSDASEFRANDDGEPSGTAGRPILGELRANELTHILVAVVRYFGGIKLGVSGLIEAYRTATADALTHCEMVWREVMVRMRMEFAYEDTHNVYATLKRYEGEVLSEDWNERCQMVACFKKSYGAQAIAELSGLPQFEVLGEY